MPATLHLPIGPVGSGKSTRSQRRALASGALFINADSAMVRLYGADPRPAEGRMAWYLERRERVRALLWDLATEVIRCDRDVYLELGLVTRAERWATYERARAADLPLQIYLFDASRALRRERVAARNTSAGPHTQVVPPAFFEAASDAWEPVDEAERTARAITEG